MKTWNECKRILCIRPDNMGDLLMSGPAIRALKKTFKAHITVLTSSMAAGIAAFMPGIDDVIVFDMPWVKVELPSNNSALKALITDLQNGNFDAAVIFTVFSQNPLPIAVLAYQAGIPRVLAYCRENPYNLLTDWVPDEEPYTLIRHQVERDLLLVKTIGADTPDCHLQINAPNGLWPGIQQKLQELGVNLLKPWLLLHAGASETKRRYPGELWVDAGRKLIANDYQIILTGTTGEARLVSALQQGIGCEAIDATGKFNLAELICLIKHSALLLSVNTGTVHIAAAVGTPVVVLYAQTNPQHSPWQVSSRVLEFPVDESLHSQNEVLRYLQKTIYCKPVLMPSADEVVYAVKSLFRQSAVPGRAFHGMPAEDRATAAS